MTKGIEYEFTLPDGSKRYEFIDAHAGYSVIRQMTMFLQMHGAVSAKPVELRQPIEDTTEIVAEIANARTFAHGDDRDGTVHVTGGWGDLYCDPVTGNVIRYDRGGDWEKEGDGYDAITRVDVDEWRETYPEGNIHLGHDILDFGTWDKDGGYNGPEFDWRFNLWLDRESDPDARFRIALGKKAAAAFDAWKKEQAATAAPSEALDLLNRGKPLMQTLDALRNPKKEPFVVNYVPHEGADWYTLTIEAVNYRHAEDVSDTLAVDGDWFTWNVVDNPQKGDRT